jgi:hypothetical protein
MNSTAARPSHNLWPHAIIVWFVVFAAAMAAWIAVAMRQNMDLVRSDYYEEEVCFQQQLDRLNRTAAIRSEVMLIYDASKQEITLRLPAAHLASQPVGEVHFYRPSDAALDFQVPLAVDAGGLQRIGTSTLRAGLWKVRMQWSAAEHDYFFEQTLVVDVAERNPIAATRTK